MEGKKRKREQEGSSSMEEPALKKREGEEVEGKEGEWSWDETTLPPELVFKILSEVTFQLPQPKRDFFNSGLDINFSGAAMGLVCGFVCKWWRAFMSDFKHLNNCFFHFNEAAARSGWMDLLKWSKERWTEKWLLNCHVSAAAAEGGHFECLKWLRENEKCPWDTDTLLGACRAGRLDIFQYCYKDEVKEIEQIEGEGISFHTDKWKVCTRAAATSNNFDLVQWLIRTRAGSYFLGKCPWWLGEIMRGAAAEGASIEMIQFLYSFRTRSDGIPFFKFSTLASEAGSCGNIDVMSWALREGGCDMDVSFCVSAARHGRLDTLKWLRERGCPWDERVPESATVGGHLEVLQWLKEMGCPMDGRTTTAALRYGQFKLARWARVEGGCPFEPALWSPVLGCPLRVPEREVVEMLQWLKEQLALEGRQLFEDQEEVQEAGQDAERANKFEVLKWLEGEGYKP